MDWKHGIRDMSFLVSMSVVMKTVDHQSLKAITADAIIIVGRWQSGGGMVRSGLLWLKMAAETG